jgi:hypothetical protein
MNLYKSSYERPRGNSKQVLKFIACLFAFLPIGQSFANGAFDQFGSRDWSQRIAKYRAAHPAPKPKKHFESFSKNSSKIKTAPEPIKSEPLDEEKLEIEKQVGDL